MDWVGARRLLTIPPLLNVPVSLFSMLVISFVIMVCTGMKPVPWNVRNKCNLPEWIRKFQTIALIGQDEASNLFDLKMFSSCIFTVRTQEWYQSLM